MSVPFSNREERLQAIIAATLRSQGMKPKKGKKKGWITRQEIQQLQREQLIQRVKDVFKEN